MFYVNAIRLWRLRYDMILNHVTSITLFKKEHVFMTLPSTYVESFIWFQRFNMILLRLNLKPYHLLIWDFSLFQELFAKIAQCVTLNISHIKLCFAICRTPHAIFLCVHLMCLMHVQMILASQAVNYAWVFVGKDNFMQSWCGTLMQDHYVARYVYLILANVTFSVCQVNPCFTLWPFKLFL